MGRVQHSFHLVHSIRVSNFEEYVMFQLTVTVARSPSGTLATMIPIKKTTDSINLYFRACAIMKKVTPRKTATAVMIWMKCETSIAIGVLSLPRPLARLAIRPITVLSPVCTATPTQFPSNPLVEKNARFLVSKGFSLVQSGPLLWGSDSPVSEELSTYMETKNPLVILAKHPYD